MSLDTGPEDLRQFSSKRSLEQVFDLAQRRIVITGAASGLGRAVALGFADLGATVIALDVHQERLEELDRAAAERGAVMRTVRCDVSNEGDVVGAFDQVAAEGDIHALLHFAGIAGPMMPVKDTRLPDWERVQATNLTSAFLVARQAIPLFVAEEVGKIVLTSSTWGIVGSRRAWVAAYAASKAGVIGLAMQLAMELAPRVTVNTIVPAGVRSGIADGFYDDPAAVEGLRQDLPVGDITGPDALIGLCTLLATSASDHMTGSVLPIDGGFLAY